jgi:radical SAM superfamily enzyme YgiQ (UPF0313 family)
MKVLFVHNGYESLGIEYLSAALKAAGHEVRLVIDPCLFDEAGFWRVPALARLFSFRAGALRQAEAFRPDFVAFSVFTDTLPWALGMARELKRRTGARTIFGGIHPSSAPEATLSQDCVDFVCLGEGDLALPALLAAPEGPPPAGVWAKRNGAIVKGPPPVPPADLDALPRPDKALFSAAAPVFSSGYLVSSSRGCPHACSYCCNAVYRELYRASGVPCLRRRSPENTAAELAAARDAGANFVHFTDEVFNSGYDWLDRFLPLYAEAAALPFSCFVFPDSRLASYASRLAAAGCFKVQLGVQRFYEDKRADLLGRRAANADIAAAIKALKEAGVYVTCDNILDLPDESEAELAELAAFYADNSPDHNEVFYLRLYPGTPLAGAAGPAKPAPGGLMRPAGYSPLPPRRQRAWASLLTLLPRLPAFSRRFFAARPALFAFGAGLPLRVFSRLLSRPRRDFHTLRFVRLYLRFILAKITGR